MQITVTFDSLEEFTRYLRPMEGFEDDRPEQPQQPAEAPEPEQAEDPAPAEEKPEKTAAPAVTEDLRVDARKALAKLNKQTGKNTAKELIKEIGYTKLSDVPLEKLPELMEKVKEAADA